MITRYILVFLYLIIIAYHIMINELRTSILEELGSIDNLAEIYDWIPEKFSGFPSLFFNFDRIESQVLDSNHHERVYYFTINIFQETTTLSSILAERNLCYLLDQIISVFDRSDFHGLAIKVDAVGGNISAVETENWPALHASIVLWIHTDFSLR